MKEFIGAQAQDGAVNGADAFRGVVFQRGVDGGVQPVPAAQDVFPQGFGFPVEFIRIPSCLHHFFYFRQGGAVVRVDEAVDAVIDFLEFPAGGNEGGPDCVVGWEVLERVQQAAAHLHQRGIEFLGGVAGGGKRTLVIGGVFVQGFFQPEQGGVEFSFLGQQVLKLVADGQGKRVLLQFVRRFPRTGDEEAQLVRIVPCQVAGDGLGLEFAVVSPERFHQDIPDSLLFRFRRLGGGVKVLEGGLSDLVA